jgi:hypothetical protein
MIIGLNFELIGIPVLGGRIPIKITPRPDCNFMGGHVYSHLMPADRLPYVATRGRSKTEL